MPLTRDFKETVVQMAQDDPEFRVGLLTEAVECITNNEVDIAKSLLRDYVNATIGFQRLGEIIDKTPSNLMRMLSDNGNPSIENMSLVLYAVSQHEGVKLQVRAQV